jgi:hypothetical protein
VSRLKSDDRREGLISQISNIVSSTSCCHTDFLLGFLRHLADTSDRAGIELLGLSIGDQSPFDERLGYRPSDRSEQRP